MPRALRHARPYERFRLTYCHDATLGRRDFYRQLCIALGLAPSATAAAVVYAVSQRVQDLSQEHQHPVFLLDEAHLLHQDTLDHLHILLNYEWASKALLSLVLVGLCDLEARLGAGRSRSLYSRLVASSDPRAIHVRRHRDPTLPSAFSEPAAIASCFPRTTLRDLDRIAVTCLRHAARKKRKIESGSRIDYGLPVRNRRTRSGGPVHLISGQVRTCPRPFQIGGDRSDCSASHSSDPSLGVRTVR